MPTQKSKKIYLYIFLFLIIGSLNNKNLSNFKIIKVNKINVIGLQEGNNLDIANSLNYLKMNNLFFLNELKLKKTLNSNNIIQKYSVYKKYPSTLNIKIYKTKFLAQIQKNGNNLFLGSNGKFINSKNISKDIPFIFGDFEFKNFVFLKTSIDKSNFDYKQIESLFSFKSGRWDIKTKSGLLIKLPKDELIRSLNLAFSFFNKNHQNEITMIDLRQKNQIIINGK